MRFSRAGRGWLLAVISVAVVTPSAFADDQEQMNLTKPGFGFGFGLPGIGGGGNKKIAEAAGAPDKQELSKGNVVVSAQKQANGHRWVKGAIHIKAPPHKVWETVHEERKSDPDLSYSKVLEHGKEGHVTLEQKFNLIPVIGTSVCVMKNTEVPGHRIDYWLVKSDRFKAMEGSWVLTPSEDGGTILELASYIDLGLPVPRNVIESVTAKKIERRLTNVRKMAETGKAPSIAETAQPH